MRFLITVIFVILCLLSDTGYSDESIDNKTIVYKKVLHDNDVVQVVKEVKYEKVDVQEGVTQRKRISEYKVSNFSIELKSMPDNRTYEIGKSETAVVSDRIDYPKRIGDGRYKFIDAIKANGIVYTLYCKLRQIKLDKIEQIEYGKWIVTDTFDVAWESDSGDESPTIGSLIVNKGELYAAVEIPGNHDEKPFKCWLLFGMEPQLLLETGEETKYENWLGVHEQDSPDSLDPKYKNKRKIYEKVLHDEDIVQVYIEKRYEKVDIPKDVPKNVKYYAEAKVSYFTMTLTSNNNKEVEDIWKNKVSIVSDRLRETLKIGAGRFKIIDVLKSDSGDIYVLYCLLRRIMLDKLVQNKQGMWEVIESIEITREKDHNHESPTTGSLIVNNGELFAALDLFNEMNYKPIECWQLSGEKPVLLYTGKRGEKYNEWLANHKPDSTNSLRLYPKKNNMEDKRNDESENPNKKNGSSDNKIHDNSDESEHVNNDFSGSTSQNPKHNVNNNSDYENTNNSISDSENTSDSTNTFIYLTIGITLLALLTIMFLLYSRKMKKKV